MSETVRTAGSLEWKPKPTQHPAIQTAAPSQPPRSRPGGHADLERKSIFHQIARDCLVHYLDRNNYSLWEKQIATPALEKLGFTVRLWWTVDVSPNFTRGVEAEKDGQTFHFYCLKLRD